MALWKASSQGPVSHDLQPEASTGDTVQLRAWVPSSDHKPHGRKWDGTGGLPPWLSSKKVTVEIRHLLLDVSGRLVIQAHSLTAETFKGQVCLEFRIFQISERYYGAQTMAPTEGPRPASHNQLYWYFHSKAWACIFILSRINRDSIYTLVSSSMVPNKFRSDWVLLSNDLLEKPSGFQSSFSFWIA